MHRAVIKSAWEQGKKRTMLAWMILTVLVNRQEARERGRGRKVAQLKKQPNRESWRKREICKYTGQVTFTFSIKLCSRILL